MLAVTHDHRGNLKQDQLARQFTWNFDNRLASAVIPAGSTTAVVGTHTYGYDALGRRMLKTVVDAGTSRTFVMVPREEAGMGQVVAEYLSTAALTSPLRNWVYGSYVDEPLLLEDRTALGASAAGTRERVYLHHSNNFDVQAVTNSAGATVELYAYTPYGTRSVFSSTGAARTTVPTGAAAAGASGNTSWIGNAIGFTGREHDGESGLMYYRARMYDATHGRFIGRDPLGYVDGPNVYRGWFAPNTVDPEGMFIPTNFERDKVAFCWALAESIGELFLNTPEERQMFRRYAFGDGTTYFMEKSSVRDILFNNQEFLEQLAAAQEACASGEQPPPGKLIVLRDVEPWKLALGDFAIEPDFACTEACGVCWGVRLRDTYDFNPRPPGARSPRAEEAVRKIRVYEGPCGWKPFKIIGDMKGEGCE